MKSYKRTALISGVTLVWAACLSAGVWAQNGTWATKAPLPQAIVYFPTGVINGTIYVAGGDPWGVCLFSANAYSYNPASDTWTALAPMPSVRQSAGGGVINGKFYVVSGQTGCGVQTGEVDVYDPGTNSWATVAPIPTPRDGLGVAVVNGILYAVGGGNPGPALSVVEAYDPSTNTWTTRSSMPTPRQNPGVAVIGGRIYVVGGEGSNGATLGTNEVYDPASDTWATLAPMPTPRIALALGAVNGLLYAAGGHGTGPNPAVAEVDQYNPSTDTWTTVTPLPTPRWAVGGAVVNNAFYVIGGDSGHGYLATNEAFTPGPVPVPLINQPLVPGAAAPGGPSFTLTVNGTGFVSGSVVQWNGSALATTFVSSGQVTAAVPASLIATAGTASVTVSNPAPGTTSNVVYFEVTIPTTSVAFATTDYMAGSGPYWVGVGDFNGDGKLDLAVANAFSNDLSVFLGNGDGTFQGPVTYSVGLQPASVTVGDFNGDGKLDLVVANGGSGTVSVLLGNGDGTFQSAVNYPGGSIICVGAAGDFNGDGKLDLALSDAGGSINILFGNGDGSFQSPVVLPQVAQVVSVAVGDFNGDGKLDVASALFWPNYISVQLGNGDGTFQPAQIYSVGRGPRSVTAADLNGDGKLDLVTANYYDSTVSVLLGNGDGTFLPAVNYPTGTNPNHVTTGDINGDGKPDLVVANFGGNSVSVLLGNGDGTFQPSVEYTGGMNVPTESAVGDFNGDGRTDLAVANWAATCRPDLGGCVPGEGSHVSILLQTTGAPPAVSLSSTSLNLGDQPVGSTSATQTVTLTNTGNGALNITSINLTGNFFALVTTPTSCPYTGGSVAAGASCTIDVTFTPVGQAGLGPQTGSISIGDNAAGSPQSIALSGTGTAAPTTTSISAPAITYGSAASVTVSVTSGAGTVIGSVSLTVDSGSPLTQGLSSGSTVFTISGLGGGSHSLSASYAAQGIFAASSATGTLQVNQAQPTVSFTGAPASAGYQSTFTVATSTNATTTAVITASGVCSVAGTTVTMTGGTGTCLLTATWASDNNYLAASATQSTTATKIAPTVTFTGAPASAAYQSTFTVATSTNATPTAVITASGVCSVAGTTVTMTGGTGTCLLTATWASDNNYLAASATQSTTATKIAPSVTFTGAPASAIYSTSFTITAATNASTTPTITASGVCSIAGNTVTMTSGMGTCSLTANWPTDTNYLAASASQATLAQKATSTTTLVASASSSLYGQLITFTATVVDSSPGSSGTPTGTVTLTDTTTNTVLGVAALGVVNGLDIATFSAYSLPAGLNSLTAVYSGDTNFLASSSATTRPVTITVTAAPIVSLDPMAVTFPGQDVNTTSAPMTVALMNQGDASLALANIQITGTNSSDFNMVSNTCGRSLAVGSSCTVNVTFSPQDTGTRTASLSFTDNDGGRSTPVTQLISLTGSSLSAISTNFTKPSIAGGNYIWFASVFSAKGPNDSNGHEIDMSAYAIRVFVTGGTISFTANNNVYTLPVPDAVITFDPTVTSATTAFDAANNRWMTTVPSASPPIPFPLQPPHVRAQMFDVIGHIFATGLAYQVPAGGLPGGIKNVTWSGAFSTDTPGVTITWQWGAAVYSTFSATYANASSNVLGVKSTDNGMAPCAFQNADPAGTPENFKQYLVLGATADDPGDYVGDLTPPVGVVPSLVIATVSPLPVVFATPQAQQTTSNPITVTLSNVHQSLGLNVASVTVSGDFAVAAGSSPCSTSSAFVLPAASSCTFNVTFTPTDLGTRTGTLTFNFSAPTGLDPGIVPSALKVDLAGMTVGTQTAPLVSLSQTSIVFGPQEINTQSAPQFVTLTNTGDDTLVIASLLASSDFAIVNNNCPTTIAVSASCVFGVVFKPTAIGPRGGTVTITDNAVGSPQVVSLSGFGSP